MLEFLSRTGILTKPSRIFGFFQNGRRWFHWRKALWVKRTRSMRSTHLGQGFWIPPSSLLPLLLPRGDPEAQEVQADRGDHFPSRTQYRVEIIALQICWLWLDRELYHLEARPIHSVIARCDPRRFDVQYQRLGIAASNSIPQNCEVGATKRIGSPKWIGCWKLCSFSQVYEMFL